MSGVATSTFCKAVGASRIVRALSWTTTGTAFVTALTFGRSVVLARLLSPADYGIFGLAMVVATAVSTLTSLSLTDSLIARQVDDGKDSWHILDTIWTAEVCRQLLVTILLLCSAYPCARYMAEPRVAAVLVMIAFAPCIQGFSNVGMVLLKKKIDFRKVVLHRICSELLLSAALLALAYYMRNVLALAAGQLVSAVISVFLSYRFHPYRPRLRFRWEALRGSISFSTYMVIISILTYVTTQFDNLVVGKYLGPGILGAYLLAYRLCSIPPDLLNDIVGTVMFPAFAKAWKAGEGEKVSRLFEQTVVGCLAILACVLLPLRILSGDLVHFVVGGKWMAAAPMLASLVFVGLMRGVARTVTPFLFAANRADLDAKMKAVEAAIFIPAVLILVPRFGWYGAAWAGIACYFVGATGRIVLATRLVGVWRRVSRALVTFTLLIAMCEGIVRKLELVHVHGISAAILLSALICVSFALVEGRGIYAMIRSVGQTGRILPEKSAHPSLVSLPQTE